MACSIRAPSTLYKTRFKRIDFQRLPADLPLQVLATVLIRRTLLAQPRKRLLNAFPELASPAMQYVSAGARDLVLLRNR
jgi:hypothetical protein